MRLPRPLLALAVGAAASLLGLAGVAGSTTGQTWLVRRALAARPDLGATIGAVAAAPGRVTVRDLRFVQGGAVVTVREAQAALPLWRAWRHHRFDITQLRIQGLTVDLAAPPPTPPHGAMAPGDAGSTQARAAGFGGVLPPLTLPAEVTLEELTAAGEINLSAGRGRVRFGVTGGGFRAGARGKLRLELAAALADPDVRTVELKGDLTAEMDSPRSFTHVGLKLDTEAQGARFPAGARISGDFSAARRAGGETYAADLVTQGREVLRMRAEFPGDSGRLRGSWKIDVRDADLAPFALGRPFPAVAATGAGSFETEAALGAIQLEGHLDATLGRMNLIRSELGALGEVRVAADFDLARHGDKIAVRRLAASLGGGEPWATLTALQPFEFNLATAEFAAADPARELAGLSLQGVPVAWFGPLFAGVEVAGGIVRGELVGSPRGGGLAVRSSAPISIGGLSVRAGAANVAEGLDVRFEAAFDCNPQGWQAHVDRCTAEREGVVVVSGSSRVGQLAGAGQPLRATGSWRAHLPAVLMQPVAAGAARLSSGLAEVELAASLGQVREIQAKIECRDLAVAGATAAAPLPALSAEIRADLGTAGQVGFAAPIVIRTGSRQSDIALSGTYAPAGKTPAALSATLTSTHLVVDDVLAFSAVRPAALGQEPAAAAPAQPAAPATSPWGGLTGSLALQLRRVVFSEAWQVDDLGGRLEFSRDRVRLAGVQAGLGNGGRVRLDGALGYGAGQVTPYELSGELSLRDCDPGPLLGALRPGQPPVVEGKFDGNGRIAGRAVAVEELAAALQGELEVTCKGGTLRVLPVNAGQATASTGRVAGFLGSAANVLGGLSGRKEPAVIGSRSQTVAEFAAGLYPLAFDQLGFTLRRGRDLDLKLRDFVLIAPEARLAGEGELRHQPGAALLDWPLALELRLRVRGRQGDLLKHLGALEPSTDSLGYAAFVLPLSVGGSLGQPDMSQFNAKLAALALEKSGMTEKASELLKKVIGGGK
jgi:hypothetical protein